MILNDLSFFPEEWDHSDQVICVYIITFLIFQLVVLLSISFTTRLADLGSRFIQDGLPIKFLSIDNQYLQELINESEVNIIKEAAKENVNIVNKINDKCQFLKWEVRIITVSILMLLVIGTLLASVLQGKHILVSIQTYLKFAIDVSIIYLSSVIFSLIAIVLLILNGVKK